MKGFGDLKNVAIIGGIAVAAYFVYKSLNVGAETAGKVKEAIEKNAEFWSDMWSGFWGNLQNPPGVYGGLPYPTEQYYKDLAARDAARDAANKAGMTTIFAGDPKVDNSVILSRSDYDKLQSDWTAGGERYEQDQADLKAGKGKTGDQLDEEYKEAARKLSLASGAPTLLDLFLRQPVLESKFVPTTGTANYISTSTLGQPFVYDKAWSDHLRAMGVPTVNAQPSTGPYMPSTPTIEYHGQQVAAVESGAGLIPAAQYVNVSSPVPSPAPSPSNVTWGTITTASGNTYNAATYNPYRDK